MSVLKRVRTIAPPAWMHAPEAQALMAALNPEKGAPQTLFVGGCVRNTLLNEEVGDIDLASVYTPDDVMAILKDAGIKAIPTGLDHGTVTAVVGEKSFEITTLRKDVETDGRHAVVAFTKDWREDAQRRDFTMNTLLADREGNIFDPLGQGLEDLQARRVIFVGDPAGRIKEDYLRILRFFRFHAYYGRGEPDVGAMTACKALAGGISGLSKERITQEFFKILSVDDPAGILKIMFDNSVLDKFSLSENQLQTLAHFCTFQQRYGLTALASRLYILVEMDLENLNRFKGMLLVPKVFVKDMEALDRALALPDMGEDHAVKVVIYKCGRTIAAQALMIELATDRVMNGYAPRALEIIQSWDVPHFPLSGEDLMKEGFRPGPALGQELQKREEAWIAGGFC